MTTRIPLSEASGGEIIARVVYRIISRDYHLNEAQYDRPATRLLDLALEWRGVGLHFIADYLVEASGHVAQGGTIASWLTSHCQLPPIDPRRIASLRNRRGR